MRNLVHGPTFLLSMALCLAVAGLVHWASGLSFLVAMGLVLAAVLLNGAVIAWFED